MAISEITARTSEALTDVAKTASANNVNATWVEHTRITSATAGDTVTLAVATAAVGSTLEVFNSTLVELVLAKQAGDSYLLAPSTIIPSGTGFTARIVASNTIEVVGTGRRIGESYTVATLPTVGTAELIFVSDETGGATMAFSDGTNWRRVQDRAIVS